MKGLHILFGKMLCGPVPVGHGQAVFDRILCCIIVFRIVDLFIHDGLEVWILGGEDREPSAVEQVVGLGLRVAELVHQRLHHLLDQLVGKIAVGGGGLLSQKVHVLDTVIDIVREGLVLLLFGDVALLVHILEDHLAFFFVLFTAGNGV